MSPNIFSFQLNEYVFIVNIQVIATDEDSPPYDDITYSIIKGDPENRFLIGQKTGVVTVGEVLDREQVGQHSRIHQPVGMNWTMSVISSFLSSQLDGIRKICNAFG